MKIAHGYVRVSTADQADSGLSLEAQERKIRAQAEVSDLSIERIIVDAGASAGTLSRNGMQELLTLVAQGRTEAIVVARLDRLTRSIRDLSELLETLAKRHVDLISTAESLDTSTATGRLVINVMASVSQWEREVIAERTAAALQEKRVQGRKTGGVAPYGFAFDGDRRIEEPTEQAVLAVIAELRGEGLTWQKVAETLNRRGLTNRAGNPWALGGLHRMARRAGLT